MIQWKAKFVDEGERLAKAFRRATYRTLERLGFKIRAAAQKSIKDAGWRPSPPGEPPHTHTKITKARSKIGKARAGKLPASILYGLDKESMSVFVGPSVNVVGTVGAAFEHEGTQSFRGQEFPARPFMGPALGEEIGELPGLLAEEYGKV